MDKKWSSVLKRLQNIAESKAFSINDIYEIVETG